MEAELRKDLRGLLEWMHTLKRGEIKVTLYGGHGRREWKGKLRGNFLLVEPSEKLGVIQNETISPQFLGDTAVFQHLWINYAYY